MDMKRVPVSAMDERPVYERLPNRIHYFFVRNKILCLLVSLIFYAGILFLWGNKLTVSGNYLVIIPVLVASLGFGIPGGITGGMLALPSNLLIFHLIKHPEFAPESIIIAEISGIILGTALGSLSNYFYHLYREIHNRMETETKLRKMIEEKEVLFREMHHRVKNNLNIIYSIVKLQSRRSENEEFRKQGQELENRIFSIAYVHDQLYSGGFSESLSTGPYLSKLAENILCGFSSCEVEYKINFPPEPIYLTSDSLVPLSLIINEALTNSLKYSTTEKQDPEILIDLSYDSENCRIIIKDNGPGFSPDKVNKKGLGLKLIKTLANQLKGQLEINSTNGTEIKLSFPGKVPAEN
jgi:two-component sensor histidine kinase